MVSIEQVEESPSNPPLVEEKSEQEQPDQSDDMWTDLMGKDLQMKILEEEQDEEVACDVGSVVVVDFIGRLGSDDKHDDTSGPIFHDAKDWIVVVGDKDVTPALEMGIRFLKQGQKALIFSKSKYAYGPMGRTHGDYVLPPNASVVYEIHVKEIRENVTAVEVAMSRKMIGNDCYQNEWAGGEGKGKALMLYKRAADAMTNVVAESPDDKEASAILIDCLNNIAAVELRAKEYAKAKDAATQVLVHEPNNVKALLRAARAAMLDPSSSYVESSAAIEAAEEVAPEDPEVKKLRVELGRRTKEYKKKSKAMYSKMGQGIKPEPTQKRSMGKDTENAREAPEKTTDDDRATWWRFLPYVIQLTFPFVTYGLYLIALKMSPAGIGNIDRNLNDAVVPEPEGEF